MYCVVLGGVDLIPTYKVAVEDSVFIGRLQGRMETTTDWIHDSSLLFPARDSKLIDSFGLRMNGYDVLNMTKKLMRSTSIAIFCLSRFQLEPEGLTVGRRKDGATLT